LQIIFVHYLANHVLFIKYNADGNRCLEQKDFANFHTIESLSSRPAKWSEDVLRLWDDVLRTWYDKCECSTERKRNSFYLGKLESRSQSI